MTQRIGFGVLSQLVGVDVVELNDIAAHISEHYRTHVIREGDKKRPLSIPSARLKKVQRLILRAVLNRIPSHPASHCAPRRSILTNARYHIGNKYLTTLDIENAFPSARSHRVRPAVTRGLARVGLNKAIADPITKLCCYKDQLPQGAPTSSKLLDLVFYPVDASVAREAKRHGIRYTRYVDDFCISAGRGVGFFVRIVGMELGRFGFRLKHAKRRDYTPGRRATVTGLVLAKRPVLRLDYVKAVRAAVEGHAKGERLLTAIELACLRGRIGWIKTVHPKVGVRLAARING